MRRGINRLRPLQIERFKGPGKLSDGNGLYLVVGLNGSRTWVFRYTRQGQAVELGLGAVVSVPVKQARTAAADLRGALAAGEDPRAHRVRQRQLAALKHARSVTFENAAEQYIEANKAGWRNAKHGAQWTATLKRYAYPVFGNSAVADVTVADVLKVLSPIWSTKPETASRLRGRIEAVLDYGKVHGWREGENPARWKGGLEMTLPARGKVRRIKHHAAMPYVEVPALLKTSRCGRRRGAAGAPLRDPDSCPYWRGDRRAVDGNRHDRATVDHTAGPHEGRARASRAAERSSVRSARAIAAHVRMGVPRAKGQNRSFQHGFAADAPPRRQRSRYHARLQEQLPRLGSRADRLSARGHRIGLGTHNRISSRIGLSAVRSSGEASATDGGVGSPLRRASRGQPGA